MEDDEQDDVVEYPIDSATDVAMKQLSIDTIVKVLVLWATK
jgi:hypothetical protein